MPTAVMADVIPYEIHARTACVNETTEGLEGSILRKTEVVEALNDKYNW